MADYIHPKFYYSQCYLETIAYTVDGIEYLAATWGWDLQNEKPEEVRQIKVSTIKLTEYNRFLVGLKIKEFQDSTGIIPGGPLYGYRYINFSNWNEITETRPFPPPRKGKDRFGPYRWHWEAGSLRGAWHRYYMQECDGCGEKNIDPHGENLTAPCGEALCCQECLEAHQEWCKECKKEVQY